MSRFARAVDANHKQIADGLRGLGYLVLSLAPLGNGAPDLLVFGHGRWALLEVKNPRLPESKQALTPLEKLFFALWRARGAPVFVVKTLDEALTALQNAGRIKIAAAGEAAANDNKHD